MIPCRTSFDNLYVISDLSSSTSSKHWHFSIRMPPLTAWQKHGLDEVEDILNIEILSTIDGSYQFYLENWHGRLDLNYTWMYTNEVQ